VATWLALTQVGPKGCRSVSQSPRLCLALQRLQGTAERLARRLSHRSYVQPWWNQARLLVQLQQRQQHRAEMERPPRPSRRNHPPPLLQATSRLLRSSGALPVERNNSRQSKGGDRTAVDHHQVALAAAVAVVAAVGVATVRLAAGATARGGYLRSRLGHRRSRRYHQSPSWSRSRSRSQSLSQWRCAGWRACGRERAALRVGKSVHSSFSRYLRVPAPRSLESRQRRRHL
jgi:hypothetical protein